RQNLIGIISKAEIVGWVDAANRVTGIKRVIVDARLSGRIECPHHCENEAVAETADIHIHLPIQKITERCSAYPKQLRLYIYIPFVSTLVNVVPPRGAGDR